MKVLVLGASGMAGHAITITLMEIGHDVTAFSRTPVGFCSNITGDAKNLVALEDIISGGNFDYVINAIGILNKAADENKSDAVFINSFLPHYLSELSGKYNTRLIHLSTDCVFTGGTGGYKEADFKDGTTFYDKTKALGEVDNEKDLTFRNSIIGPDTKEEGIGLFNWFMKQNDAIKGYASVFWSGVTTTTLSKAIDRAMMEELTGIYHLTNNEKISKYDLLVLVNSIINDNKININMSLEPKIDKSLINTRKDFTFEVPTYEEMIIEMADWIRNHKKLYPHYRI